jgi:hypothetical protein
MPWVLTPPLAYMIEAQRITRQMQAQGVVLTMDQAHELARAHLGPPRRWVAQEPELTEKGRLILDRIVAERARLPSPTGCTGCDMGGHRHQPCTAPELHPETAEDPDPSSIEDGTGEGHPGTAARQQQQNPEEIDPITRYLQNVPDPDDDAWTPT